MGRKKMTVLALAAVALLVAGAAAQVTREEFDALKKEVTSLKREVAGFESVCMLLAIKVKALEGKAGAVRPSSELGILFGGRLSPSQPQGSQPFQPRTLGRESVRLPRVCSTCDGTGHSLFPCGVCKGTGMSPATGLRCMWCHGRRFSECFSCHGTGKSEIP